MWNLGGTRVLSNEGAEMQETRNFTQRFQRGAITAACALALLCGTSAAFAQQPQTTPQDQQAPPPDQSQAAPQSAPDQNAQQGQAPADQQSVQQQDPNAVPPAPDNDPNTAPPPPSNDSMTPGPMNGAPNGPSDGPVTNPAPNYNGQPNNAPQPNYAPRTYAAPNTILPDPLTIPAGTVIQIRTTDWLSSDKNHKGDQFIGTLAAPIIVNGWVVARRGQSVTGTVTDAVRAGRVKGVSKLQLDLGQLTLVDGQLIPVQTTLLNASAGTSKGRDASAIAVTTGTGAAIGAAAGGGVGAGIGAGAGLVASVAGVLLTRGKPTIIPPEDVLTFKVENAISFTTVHGPRAFLPATPQDYQPVRPPQLRPRPYPYAYGYPPPPGPYGYYPYGYGYAPPPPVAIGYYGGYYRYGWGWGW
jgi:hypothetical protein